MTLGEHLLGLEKRFWTSGADFYQEALTDDSLMAFPEPVGILKKGATVQAIATAPRWAEVTFRDERIVELGEDAVVLTYNVSARREGEETSYSALVGSVYVNRDGSWKLAFHQQTPASER